MCLRNGDTISFYLIFQSLISASLFKMLGEQWAEYWNLEVFLCLHPALQCLSHEGFLPILNSSECNKIIGSLWI